MKARGYPGVVATLLMGGCGSDTVKHDPTVFEGAIDVETHESQPMVVDLVVHLSDTGEASAKVASDAGVRVSAKQSAPDEVKVRLRGLAPSSHYDVSVRATLADGTAKTRSVGVDTLAPLPGFVGQFSPVVSGEPSAEYRLFDFQSFPKIDDSAIYVVDAQGTTRFYLSVPTKLTDPYPVAKLPSAVRLLPDGTISFVQDHDFWVLDELGEVKVHVPASALGVTMLHHDAIKLPNGNFMAIGLTFRTIVYADEPEPANVGGDTIVEFTAEGEKVWSWDSFDHLDPQRRKDSFYDSVFDPTNMNAPGYDWTHSNAIVYSASDDTVLLSVRHQDWLVLIDHATGNIISKIGDEGDYSLPTGRWFFHQHGPEWQADGSLLLFDNGNSNPYLDDSLERSRALRLALDRTSKTARIVWETGGEPYMSPIGGNAYHLDNGDVLTADCFVTADWTSQMGHGRIREFDADAAEVWTLDFADSNNAVYRATPIHVLPGEEAAAPDGGGDRDR